jgi:hypothetical protein
MLRILYRLDKTDTVEANLVAEAANRLGVGEFQFFRLAHESWFGADVDPKQLEPAFLGYMQEDAVPPYVRHFARTVIQRDDAGLLDPEADEFHRFDAGGVPPPRSLAGTYTIAMVLLITAAFMALNIYTYRPGAMQGQSCNFPPCPHFDLRPPP